MARVRVFNPSAYTPRAYFAGEEGGQTKMARHRHHHRRHNRHRRHNPFGVRGTVISDSLYTAVGAIGVPFAAGFFNLSGWADVGATFGISLVAPMVAKMAGMGGSVAEEIMKGGIAAGMIKVANQFGLTQKLGMGLYAPSWFGVPTASSQYLRAYNANIGPAPRGQGTLYVPGPNGGLVPGVITAGPGGVPAAVPTTSPAAAAAAGGPHGTGMGYHRFRSRYQGNY
jgi:hypothetical protein